MPSSFGFSENRRDFFRNQAQMRFRWRLVGGLEFSFQKTFFAANGYLPPSREERSDSSPSWNLSYWEDPSLIDVSGGGCSFPLPAHLHKPADVLEVQLAMEDGSLLCAIVDVVRRYYRDPHHWIGCRFLLISRKDQEKLIQYQTRVQRSALKKRLEEKLIEVPVVVEAKTVEEKQEEPEEVPTLLVTTPVGNIRERRKLVRVDDSLAILWQVMWGEEAESIIGIFKQFGTFPQLHNKPAMEEKKTLELEVALRHLGLHAPAIKEGMVALWQEVERLYGLVSPQKKVNPFLPLFMQLVSTAHKLTTLNGGISSLHADILKDYRRFLQMAFAADPALSPRQLQQLLRQELTEISKKFRVLYRIAPTQKDVIYPFFDHLSQMADLVTGKGVKSIFAHQTQPVNLSGSGLAFADFEVPAKQQLVYLRVGIPETPWQWIPCIGKVVSEHTVASNRRLIKDGKLMSQKKVAIHFSYIHPNDQGKLIAYVNLKTTEPRREQFLNR